MAQGPQPLTFQGRDVIFAVDRVLDDADPILARLRRATRLASAEGLCDKQFVDALRALGAEHGLVVHLTKSDDLVMAMDVRRG